MPSDALTLLHDDHRRLQQSFDQFQATRSLWVKEELAGDIIAAIRTHLDLDRTVIYPALSAAGDDYNVSQCLADHEQIEQLLDEIEHAGPTDDAFFAKIHLLCERFDEHSPPRINPKAYSTKRAARRWTSRSWPKNLSAARPCSACRSHRPARRRGMLEP